MAMGKLFDEITDYYNFVDADAEVAHGKRDHQSYIDMEREREMVYNSRIRVLRNHTYRHGKLREKVIFEPKRRELLIPRLSDRLIHHAVTRVIKPYLEAYFHKDSFSCRKGSEYIKVYLSDKGDAGPYLTYFRNKNHRNTYPRSYTIPQAVNYVREDAEQQFPGQVHKVVFEAGRGQLAACRDYQAKIRSAIGRWGWNFYILAIDFKSFYASINHEVLMFLYGRLIKDPEVLWLLRQIIDACPNGLPIGFLPSQDGGNIIGSTVDYMDTDTLGIKLYGRYADDIRILCQTREQAERYLAALDTFVNTRLKMRFSDNKTKIYKWAGKDTFCGYVVCPHHFEPKPTTVKRAHRRMNKKLEEFKAGKITAQQLHDTAESHLAYRAYTSKPYDALAESCIRTAAEAEHQIH